MNAAASLIKYTLIWQIYFITANNIFHIKGRSQTVLFKKGIPHRFWNDGDDILHCIGYVKPANTLVFYLSSIYAAQNKTNSAVPEKFDSAYLLTRYASEYDLDEIPVFVKKVILPATYFVGRLLGKYKHFDNAPEPVKA